MWQTVQLVILGVLAGVFGLSAMSRRYPHVGWLRPFRFTWPQLPQAQRERMRRRANIHAGIELILLGFAVPIVYVGSSIMMFSDPSARGLTISIAIAALLIALGITGVWRNARRRTDSDLGG
jgi:nitrate reductase gamma subunit